MLGRRARQGLSEEAGVQVKEDQVSPKAKEKVFQLETEIS